MAEICVMGKRLRSTIRGPKRRKDGGTPTPSIHGGTPTPSIHMVGNVKSSVIAKPGAAGGIDGSGLPLVFVNEGRPNPGPVNLPYNCSLLCKQLWGAALGAA